MYSRKDSVKRHIKNEHNGYSLIVSFVDYLAGRVSGIYLPRAPPTYEKKREVNQQPKTYMDIFTEEGVKEMARQSVNKAFNQPRTIFSRFDSNNSPQLRQLQQGYYSFWGNPNDIFGLGVYICEKCLEMNPFKICFVGNAQKGFAKESFDYCDPEFLNNFRGIPDKDEYVKGLRNRFPGYLKDCVDVWAILTNSTKSNNLVTIKVSEHPPNNTVIITQQQGTMQKSVTFEYSIESKCIDLGSISEDHWAAKAIKQSRIALSNDELMDFLRQVNDTTYAFFRVRMHESRSTYFMYITTGLLEQPSADDASKNSTTSSNQDELLADLKIWKHPFQGTQSRPLKGFTN
jgi:hypothetical protein